jgi:cytochrome c oxidase cbb3-type subunit 3
MSAESRTPGKPAREEDRLLDHNYDGIQEYDNPMPRWWVYIFWATIVWAVLYALNLPGIGTGKGRIANYERDMAAAREKFAGAQGPQVTDDALLALGRAPDALQAGKTQFATTCAVCHRPDGGGQIGPNLTDAYWIHGNRPTDLYRTVNLGVPDKGMPAWGQVLKPDQVAAVVAYVLTLRGTHPENPKEPQGINADSAAAAAGATGAPGADASSKEGGDHK